MTDAHAHSNHYPIDVENAAELARLIDQDTLFTQTMGGLLPEQVQVPAHASILALACGPGGWALDTAYAHPDAQVAGVDISQTMVAYANARSRTQCIPNASFEVMNIALPLDFSDHSFHLVHARFLAGVLSPLTWPQLLAECIRILKPGGILCLSECEVGVSSSPALQRLNGLLYQALHTHQRTYSVDGQSIGIVHMLAPLLGAAGFRQINTRPFVLDASYGEPLYYQFSKEIEVIYALLKPYLVEEAHVVNSDMFDATYRQSLIDTYQPDFACTTFGLTAWGYKLQKETMQP